MLYLKIHVPQIIWKDRLKTFGWIILKIQQHDFRNLELCHDLEHYVAISCNFTQKNRCISISNSTSYVVNLHTNWNNIPLSSQITIIYPANNTIQFPEFQVKSQNIVSVPIEMLEVVTQNENYRLLECQTIIVFTNLVSSILY